MSIFQQILNWCSNLFKKPIPIPLKPLPTCSTQFGVAVHFVNNIPALSRIADWKVTYVRMDFVPEWYQANPTNYDALVSSVTQLGMIPILITPYILANDTITTPQSYASTLLPIVQKYKNYPIVWEIMNEPDIGAGNPANKKFTAAQYYPYLVATAQMIKENSSHVVFTGGTSGSNPTFHTELAGLIKDFGLIDGIGYHPYDATPQTIKLKLQQLYNTYNEKYKICCTEYGATSYATLSAMLEAARNLTPMFNVYVYQENVGTNPQYNLVEASTAVLAPPTGLLNALLAQTTGVDRYV